MKDVNDLVKEIKLSKKTLYCHVCGGQEDEQGFNCTCPATLITRGEFERAIKEAEKIYQKHIGEKNARNRKGTCKVSGSCKKPD